MGLNSTIVVFNDQLSSIENDPQFGKKVCDGIMNLCSAKGEPVYIGAASVIETHHSSSFVPVLVGHNTGYKIKDYCTYINSSEDVGLQLLKDLADHYGYTLRKKPKRK